MIHPPTERQITDGLRELRRIENLSLPEIREIERRFSEMDGRFLEDPPDRRVREAFPPPDSETHGSCARGA